MKKVYLNVKAIVASVGLLLGGVVNAIVNEAIPSTRDALKISLNVKSFGSELETEVTFTNVSKNPLRVYFIEDTVFNAFQSFYYVVHQNGQKSYVAEELLPHGYMPDASDFHLIKAGQSKIFTQKITDVELLEKSKPVALEWVYRNSICKWQEGKKTLDGITRSLFDSEEIPGIWTGQIKASVEIKQ